MSLSIPEAPDYGRIGSQSALDFAYWMLTYSTQVYKRDMTFGPNEGLRDNGLIMMVAIKFSLDQIEVPSIDDYSAFRSRCKRRTIPNKAALRTRGALMFKGEDVVMCLGDTQRILESRGEEFVVRYLTLTEKQESYWDFACRIPGVVYL